MFDTFPVSLSIEVHISSDLYLIMSDEHLCVNSVYTLNEEDC